MELVKSFLIHPSFQIEHTRKKADILWLCDHFKKFRWSQACWNCSTFSVGVIKWFLLSLSLFLFLFFFFFFFFFLSPSFRLSFSSLRPEQFVNQFPCEHVLTCKDLLVIVAKRANQTGASPQEVGVATHPKWLPQTFNLLHELPHMVHCYLEREKRWADYFILWPWWL